MANNHLAEAASQMAQWRKRKKEPRKRSVNPATKDFQEYVGEIGSEIARHEGYSSSHWSTEATITAKLAEAQPEHREPILAEAVKEARRRVKSAREEFEKCEAALTLIEAIAAGGSEMTIRQQRTAAERTRQAPIVARLIAAWDSGGTKDADWNSAFEWLTDRFPDELTRDIREAQFAIVANKVRSAT